jgi:hypothetical protein
VVVLALVNCILRLHALDGKRKDAVSYLTGFNFAVEGFVTVLALDVGHFVRPPHDGLPV